jgi:hypothetical protein
MSSTTTTTTTPKTTTTTTVKLHMTIHCEGKNVDLIDDQLIVSIDDTTNGVASLKNAFDRLSIGPSPAPSYGGVRFSNVSIREYSVIVGDNPGGMYGPPLSIGWEYGNEVTLDVMDYEQQRPPRRKGREMLIPAEVRVERLRDAGYSRAEIVSLTKPVNVARSQRKKTLDTLHLQPLFQLHEKLSRSTISMLTGGRRKKTEMKLLAHRPEAAIRRAPAAVVTPPKSPEEHHSVDNHLSLAQANSEDTLISL